MTTAKWNVIFEVYREKSPELPHFDKFDIQVDPDEYVLDGIERIWAFYDRSLCFRHACHHSTCGACGMRVNGVEKLTCITSIRSVTRAGGTIKVEPLRNFPVVGDLAVDMGVFYQRMEQVGQRQIVPLSEEPDRAGIVTTRLQEELRRSEVTPPSLRLSDCIECGLCISACPITATTPAYLGPAVLAGAQQNGLARSPGLLQLVDSEDGVWRCHNAHECTAVCPSFVEPAWRIMDLRKQIVAERIKGLFHPTGGNGRQPEVSK